MNREISDTGHRAPPDEAHLRGEWAARRAERTSTIVLVDYNPQWPELFMREAKRVRAVLGSKILRMRVQEYADAKTSVVEEILNGARQHCSE